MGTMLTLLLGVRPTAGNVANCLPRDRIKIGQRVNECVHSYALAHNYQLSCATRVHSNPVSLTHEASMSSGPIGVIRLTREGVLG